MKQVFLGLGLVLALAACGGGGGTPNPIPSTVPKTTYTSKLVFVGPLDGRVIQSDLRRVESLTPMTAATPLPIMVVAPITAQGNIGANQSSNWGGTIQAEVSPAPASTPTTTFSQTDPNAVLGTPIPFPTANVVSEAPIMGNSSTPNVQSSGVATAAIGAPVNLSPQANEFTYMAISLECKTPLDPGSSPAYQWNGTGWIAVSDPTQADVYLTGPQCTVPGFSSTENNMVVHIPYGGVNLSTDTPFSGLLATQWSNTETAVDLLTAGTVNPDGSQNTIIVAKTSGGAVFKLFPLSVGYNDGYDGAVEVSGSSVDGF